MKRTLAIVGVFSIAFGFVEAAVVVYLRLHYYSGGFEFPLVEMPSSIAVIEVMREFATIVMLGAVGWVSGKRPLTRFAFFAVAFGVWDIFYYVFLKVMLGWPASLFTWDVLFLIPLPWLGPVLAPVIVSVCLITAGVLVLVKEEQGRPVRVLWKQWMALTIGGTLIIYSFLEQPGVMFHHELPGSYDWPLFVAGIAVGIAGFVWSLRASRLP
jgi:hypothetical protein